MLYKKTSLSALLESSDIPKSLPCSQVFWVFFLEFIRKLFSGRTCSMGITAVFWWPVSGVKQSNKGTNFCHWENSRKQSFLHLNFFFKRNLQIFKTSSDWSPLTWIQSKTRIWEILMQTSVQQRPYIAMKRQLYVEKITVRGHSFPFLGVTHLPFIIICLQYRTFSYVIFLSCYSITNQEVKNFVSFHINELWKNPSPFFKL